MGLIKAEVKDMAKEAFYYSGISGLLFKIVKLYKHPALLIVTYHRVYPASGGYEYIGVSQDVFESHVKFIKDNFRLVSMQEGLEALHRSSSREIYAAINLDDGYMDNYTNAFSVLRKYSAPATVFLTTDFIGKEHIFWWDRVFNIISSVKSGSIAVEIDSAVLRFSMGDGIQRGKLADRINKILVDKHEDDIERFIKDMERRFGYKERKLYPMLGWSQIREMSNHGISFGSHTRAHKNMCLMKDAEIIDDLRHSRRRIEQGLGFAPDGFSYPFGIFDHRVKALVRGAGFRYARANLKSFNYKGADRFQLSCIGAGSVLKPSFLAARLFSALLKPQYRKVTVQLL